MRRPSHTAWVTGFDERSTRGVTFVHNESVAALADRQPERFIPFAGADVLRGSAAVAELEIGSSSVVSVASACGRS